MRSFSLNPMLIYTARSYFHICNSVILRHDFFDNRPDWPKHVAGTIQVIWQFQKQCTQLVLLL